MVVEMSLLQDSVLPEDFLEIGECKTISSISELIDVLEKITDEVFSYYVGTHYNEFSTWIEECYGNKSLALKVQKIKRRKQLISCLRNALKKETQFLRKKKSHLVISPPKNKAAIFKEISQIDISS